MTSHIAPPHPGGRRMRLGRRARAAALAAALLAASLAVSSGGQAVAQSVSEQTVTFVSNLGQHANTSTPFTATDARRATPFTTGSSTDGYQLTSMTLSMKNFGVFRLAVYDNGAGNVPGSQVGTDFTRTTYGQSDSFEDVTVSGASVSLAPNTTYWVVLTHDTGQPEAGLAASGVAVDSGGQSGWALGGRYYTFASSSWSQASANYRIAVKLSGMVSGTVTDSFSADSSTNGRLELGTVSSGTLSDRDDRDLFKLENLPATSNSARDGQANRWNRKRYRVQAWFGDHAPGDERGGEVFLMEGSPSGSSSLYSSVSDTNEDGLSFFEFEAFPNIDYYVMVVPTAPTQVFKTRVVGGDIEESYELENRTYTGPYKLQIDDVSHIEEMATTLHLATPSGRKTMTVSSGSTQPLASLAARLSGLDRTVPFYTGANSGGYVLNRVEAAVSQTEVSAFAANAKVSIYSDGTSGSPGTELFTLKTPADVWGPRTNFDDYEESFWVPSGTTADLDASTWYWVVFALNTGATRGGYRLDLVDNASADVKSGWQIHQDSRTRSRTIANDPWTLYADDATNRSIQIGIYASPNTGTDHKNPVPLDTAPTGGI